MKIRLLQQIVVAIFILMPCTNFGQAPNLGSASSFALFTAAGAFNNTGATTTVTGDVGTDVGAFNAFPPGILVGQIHVSDPVSAQAATDVALAYGSVSTVTCGSVISTTMGGGQMLLPDVYCLGAASTINGDLILDGQGDPNSIFIFKIDGALATTVNSRVLLTNSASLCNVYWQVNGEVDLGDNSLFQGTILANGAINLLLGAKLNGRALSTAGAINLNSNLVTLSLQPTASVIVAGGATTFCAGGSVILTGNIGGTWSTGATTASITVNTSGDYFVTNTNACGSVVSNHIIVTVNPAPEASVITADGPTTFCAGGSVTLSGNSGGTWSTGATTASITVNTSGDYFVTNTNACGSVVSNHIIVTVNPAPEASVITADGPTTFCAGGSVTLSGNSGGTWSTGATTASITVNTSGDYFVTNTNACGSVNSNHIIVTVSSAPVASVITAGGPTTFCAGGSVTLSGNSGGTWSTGATTASITVNTSGDYFVTNTNACGSVNSNHIIVTVSSAPVASVITAGGPTTFCAGGSVTLSGNSGGIWSTGASTASITVNTSGDYFVTNTNACGSVVSNHIIVTVNPAPVASVITAGGPNTFCPGGSVTLSGNSGGTWSTGASTASITVNTSGDYFVTNTNACGSVNSNHIIVTVSSAPVASVITAGGPTTFCAGGSVTLSGNSGGTWSTGASTASITVNTSGDYFVTNTNACGSVVSNHIIVSVSQLPACTITGNSVICQGQSTQLCAPAGCTTYLWSNGATTRCITVSAAGTYTVTTTNSSGCTSTCSKTVTLSASPACTITGNSVICQGQSTQLCAPAGCTTYLWSNGATTRCITVSAAGTYTVTTTNSGGCTSTCSKTVTVSASPACTITGNSVICQGQSTQLCAPAGCTQYLWSNGATTRCITVSAAGTYTVTTTNSGGCSSTCSKTVTTNYGQKTLTQTSEHNASDSRLVVKTLKTTNAKSYLIARAYPNPFSTKAFIEFQSIDADSHVVIDFYTLLGVKIATLFDQNVKQGAWYKAEINGENISSGVYLYKITNGKQIINGKLILMK